MVYNYHQIFMVKLGLVYLLFIIVLPTLHIINSLASTIIRVATARISNYKKLRNICGCYGARSCNHHESRQQFPCELTTTNTFPFNW